MATYHDMTVYVLEGLRAKTKRYT